jgi:hypothetical protein
VTGSPKVTDVADISKGPAKLDGYRHRFTFRNPGAVLTAEVAAVPSGPTASNAEGDLEYSVILVWVSDRPGAPKADVIDQIVGSTLVRGGVPAP